MANKKTELTAINNALKNYDENTNLVYPAVITQGPDTQFGTAYMIDFIDLKCSAHGYGLKEALANAKEAMATELAKYFANGATKDLPPYSNISDFPTLGENQCVGYIELNIVKFYQMRKEVFVKKTLTLPSWLEEIGKENDVNFSEILKEALIEKFCSKQN